MNRSEGLTAIVMGMDLKNFTQFWTVTVTWGARNCNPDAQNYKITLPKVMQKISGQWINYWKEYSRGVNLYKSVCVYKWNMKLIESEFGNDKKTYSQHHSCYIHGT